MLLGLHGPNSTWLPDDDHLLYDDARAMLRFQAVKLLQKRLFSPGSAINNVIDIRFGYAKALTKRGSRFLSSGTSTYLCYFHDTQFVHTVTRSTRRVAWFGACAMCLALCLSTLRNLIGGVISTGAQEKMIRSHARRVVTLVEHPKAIRDRAVSQFPGHAGCYLTGIVDTNNPIPSATSGSLPFPTSVRIIHTQNTFPEALLKWRKSVGKVTRKRAIGCWPAIESIKRRTAMLTHAGYFATNGVVTYTGHVVNLLSRFTANPRQFIAARGLSVPIITRELLPCY